jgi:hypothetical protein
MAKTVTDLRSRRSETQTCSACGGAGDDHVYGCPNYRCPECGMSAGNHADACTVLAAMVEKANPAIDGTTGEPIAESDDEDAAERDEELEAERQEDLEAERDGSGPRGRKRKEAEELRRVPPPEITAELVRDLQDALEQRQLVGLKQPLSRAILCEEIHIVADVEVGCSGLAAVAIVDERTCSECEKMKSKRELALCIAHGALYAAGEAVDPQLKFQLVIE